MRRHPFHEMNRSFADSVATADGILTLCCSIRGFMGLIQDEEEGISNNILDVK